MFQVIVGCVIANIVTILIIGGVLYYIYKKNETKIKELNDKIDTKVDEVKDKVNTVMETIESIKETIGKLPFNE